MGVHRLFIFLNYTINLNFKGVGTFKIKFYYMQCAFNQANVTVNWQFCRKNKVSNTFLSRVMRIIDFIAYDVILAIAAFARLSATVKSVHNHAFLPFYFLLFLSLSSVIFYIRCLIITEEIL